MSGLGVLLLAPAEGRVCAVELVEHDVAFEDLYPGPAF
jgi:hypothetical protein